MASKRLKSVSVPGGYVTPVLTVQKVKGSAHSHIRTAKRPANAQRSAGRVTPDIYANHDSAAYWAAAQPQTAMPVVAPAASDPYAGFGSSAAAAAGDAPSAADHANPAAATSRAVNPKVFLIGGAVLIVGFLIFRR